ncbi:choice-of-anchor tandem repeat GloVer-containing protein [Segetibacter koreensis]|uniref:choice-of-anchor tandem repeat GloVer-containing protein n=1 Tax=Segetibacter koreensis TaxID=398037 RepID=UPI000377933E|nr:choice-of-anchor tandem repeat GloVer-containing protein [Segetibacter koreensis]
MKYSFKLITVPSAFISSLLSLLQKHLFLNKIVVLSLSLLLFSVLANATIHVVTVANFAFTPSNISNVLVGDTVRWVWGDGSHTTTCDPGSQGPGNSLPAGAATWNSPINSFNTTFDYKVTVPGVYKYWCIPHSPHMAASFTASNAAIAQDVLMGLTSTGGSQGKGTAFTIKSSGSGFSVVTSFAASVGTAPFETFLKGKDSAYYGTTSSGGKNNSGNIIKICGGSTTVLYSFNKNIDGGSPKGSLIQATDGNLYGMTTTGGTNGNGTIFRIKTSGAYTVLRNLKSATDGGSPQGSLVQGKDGSLYGVTSIGGAMNAGTIFKISLTGTFKVLRHLSVNTDGGNPEGNLIQGKDGNFYGLTKNSGRIFKITSAGTFTSLHTFVSTTDGGLPSGSLVESSDGNFYGTTSSGGSFNGGTIFKVSSTGSFKVLKQLNPAPDGTAPKGNLLIGSDGNFYGLTSAGGTNNAGTIFKVTSTGVYRVLRQLKITTDGGNPFGSLIITVVNKLVSKPQNITINANTNKIITLSGSGASKLNFSITVPPKNGTLTGSGASRTYTPKANFSGKDSFMFSVSLGCLASAPAKINISIKPAVAAPVLTLIGNKSIAENSTLTFKAIASNGTGTTMHFSLINAPGGAAIDATTGVFTWKSSAPGVYTFKVRSTNNDSTALYSEEEITVTVTEATITMAKVSKRLEDFDRTHARLTPNPVNNKFVVTLSKPAEFILMRIVDMKGIVHNTFKYSGPSKTDFEINVELLRSGVYVLQIETRHVKQALKFIKN